MTSEFKTEQEAFWAGEFGDDYSRRNSGKAWVATNLAFFGKILTRTENVRSVIEFGANIGLNLRAIQQLLPNAELTGIEINKSAADELRKWGGAAVIEGSILDAKIEENWDLALIKGVLIHINPEMLGLVYEQLFRSSRRYVCLAEYYNPTPTSISYRGHQERLFKRDFAGEMLEKYPSLKLVDYGFCYRRDPNFRQDDISWFLLEKK